MGRRNENNNVVASGVLEGNLHYSHEVLGEGFYFSHLVCERKSGTKDRIPITISERLVDVGLDWTGVPVSVTGDIRSCNEPAKPGKRIHRLNLSVFIDDIQCFKTGHLPTDRNDIQLNGFVCRTPKYRTTPLGSKITELLVAVNRAYGKSDYIPCIAWGRNAKFAKRFEIGTNIAIKGRIQSREYLKRFEDGTQELRTTYEVSIGRLDVIDEPKE